MVKMPFSRLLLRYGGALLALLLATVLRLLLAPVLADYVPFLTYFAATLLAAWCGGLGPSILTLIGGLLLGSHLFVPPYGALWPSQAPHWAALGLYTVTGLAIVALAESLRRSQARTAAAERRFRQLVEASSVGIATVESAGRIRYVNPALLALTGYTAEEVAMGLRWDEVTPPEWIERSALAVRALRETGRVAPYEKEYLTKDGRRVPVLVGITALEQTAGEPLLAAFVTDLTALKRTEQALLEQLRFLQTLLDAVPAPIFYKDTAGIYLGCNKAFEAYLGLSREQIVGKSAYEVAPRHLADIYRRADNELLAQGGEQRYETRVAYADGAERDVIFHKATFPASDSTCGGLVGTILDITARKRAEEALREREAELQEAQRVAHAGSWSWDRATDTVTWSEAMYRLVGRDPAQPAPRWADHAALLTPESFQRLHAATELAQQTGAPYELDLELTGGEGATRWVIGRGEVRRDAAGRIVGMRGTVQDITERKRVEAELKRSEERYRIVAEYNYDWEYWLASDGTLSYVSPSCETVSGYRPEAFLADPALFSRLVHPGDAAAFERHNLYTQRSNGDPASLDFRIIRPDGAVRWVNHVCRPVYGAAGEYLGRRASNRDITERKQAEAALRERAEEIETLLELLPVGVIIARDPQCQTIAGNRAAYDLLRMPRSVNLTRSGPDAYPCSHKIYHHGRELAPAELPIQQAATRGVTASVDVDLVFPDGTTVYVGGSAAPLFDKEGRVRGAVGVLMDLTDRKRLEESLKETDRRKDEFLATLAHELRNPLAPIANAFELIRRAAGRPELVESALAIGERQVSQLVRLVDDLLDISRITRGTIELRKARVALGEVIESALETARPAIEAAGHWLTVDLPEAPVYLEADLTRLAQALANLLINAAKFTGPGGHIQLRAQCEDDEVAIAVQDSGIGIPADQLPKLFHLFAQVAQPPGQRREGLGIGLALVRSLAELHGGRVEAASAGPGQGSTFTLRLPCARTAPAAAPAGEVPAATIAHACRVLVVDDQADVADSLAMLLKNCGHEVVTAYDGAAAIEAARTLRPEVVLLDIGMPGLDGYEVARRLRELPELQGVRLIALTGWGQEEDRQRSRAAGFDHHLVKPVELATLEALLPGGRQAAAPRQPTGAT